MPRGYGSPEMDSLFVIKVCGINDAAVLDAALAAGADMVGFVFFPRSPRHISFEAARSFATRIGRRAKTVALTVDADDALLDAVCRALDPDLLQLHGAETPAQVADVRARFGRPVMRAIAIADAADLEAVVAFDAVADHLLFDARPPAGADRPGGHGAAFDWSLLRGVATSRPWLLAGGLTDINVTEAIGMTDAYGVDVSSGVESAPGCKDPERILRFVEKARAAAAARLGTEQVIG